MAIEADILCVGPVLRKILAFYLRIYPVRPLQCRTYPFWFQNLRSEKKWRLTGTACPGIGQGRRYSKDEILALLQLTIDGLEPDR
jgi:hypothetical protein